MQLNVKNETNRLKTVVLGRAESNGPIPSLENTYDAKSYETVKNDLYPSESDFVEEMEEFNQALLKHGVEVLRPRLLENCNQIFARDVAFVIDNEFFVSNIIPDREEELQAFDDIKKMMSPDTINYLPEEVYVEGGDVLLWNDYIFVGTYKQPDFKQFKTARTNTHFTSYISKHFPHKNVYEFELKKDDFDPYNGILHLDCCFQPVGVDKAIIYKDGFLHEKDYDFLVGLFGKENLFDVTKEEMYQMNPNIFSIAPDIVVSEKNFTRLNKHMSDEWGITVEAINYANISKQGGLLRCSTMPLIRV